MLLRRFNQAGIEQFKAFIGSIKVNPKSPKEEKLAVWSQPAPVQLLTDDTLTEVIATHTECADATFENRLEAAEFLNKLLLPTGLADAFTDTGLWSWLSLRYYDELMPINKPGIPAQHLTQLGTDESRFIPSEYYQDRHRHLLRHPLQLYRRAACQPDRAMCFLVQPVYRPGDFVEQFASRQMYTWYDEMVATLSTLVVDPETKKIKPNASIRARRLDDVLQQFDCTWDLGYIAKDLLIPKLPKEFKEFRRRGRTASTT